MIKVKAGKILKHNETNERYMIIHIGILLDEEKNKNYNILELLTGSTLFGNNKTKINLEKFINTCNFSEVEEELC